VADFFAFETKKIPDQGFHSLAERVNESIPPPAIIPAHENRELNSQQ
jgi:hypothetical protein